MSRKIVYALILCVTFIFSACSNNNSSLEINDAIKQSIGMYDSIIYSEEKGNNFFVFYTKKDMLGFGLFEKNSDNWDWVQGITREMKDNSPVYFNPSQKFPILFGILMDYDEVVEVDVVIKENTKKGTVVKLPNNSLMWFVLLDRPTSPPIKITGYDKNNEIVYRDGY